MRLEREKKIQIVKSIRENKKFKCIWHLALGAIINAGRVDYINIQKLIQVHKLKWEQCEKMEQFWKIEKME